MRSASSCRAISQHLPRDRSWEVSAEAKALRSADGRTFERRPEIIDFARRKTYLCGGGLISPVPRGCDRFLEDCLRLWRRKLKADGLPREWFDGCDQAAVFIQPCLVLWMFVRKRVAVKRRRQSPEVVAAGEKPDVLQVIVYIRDQPVEHRWPPQLSGVAHKLLALGALRITSTISVQECSSSSRCLCLQAWRVAVPAPCGESRSARRPHRETCAETGSAGVNHAAGAVALGEADQPYWLQGDPN